MNAIEPDASVVQAALGAGYQSAVDVHVFDKLDSTSAWLGGRRESMRLPLEQGHAQLCMTDWQQAGVGRRGKSWQTKPGNVTFSVMARYAEPAQNLLGLSLVTGIAVADALDEALGLKLMLKWPNDVIANDRKLGGLLTEVMTVSDQAPNTTNPVTDVISGIGINVDHDETVEGLGIGATSLRAAGIKLKPSDRDALVGAIAAAVLTSHQRFLAKGWVAFADKWAELDWLMGKDVTIHKENATEHAVACGVNKQGALLVKSAGKLIPLYGGNVSIRPTL